MILHTDWTLDSAILAPVWDTWFCPLVDLFATRFSHRPPTFILQSSGRHLYSMVGSSGLRLSSAPHSVECAQVHQEGASHTHPDFPQVASSTLVPRVAVSLPCTSSHTPSPQDPSSAQVRNCAHQSRASQLSYLAAVQHSSSLGTSQGMVHKVSQPFVLALMGSTPNTVLALMGSTPNTGPFGFAGPRTTRWTPATPLVFRLLISWRSSPQIFLSQHLLSRSIMQPFALLSANSVVHPYQMTPSFGSWFVQRPCKEPQTYSIWDLFLVFSALRLSPYNPVREISLKCLTLRLVFLVALASGRRCGEVHALRCCIGARCIRGMAAVSIFSFCKRQE